MATSVEQAPYNISFKTSIPAKYFFGFLTFICAIPFVLWLLLIVLAFTKIDFSKNPSIALLIFLGIFSSLVCTHLGNVALKIATNKLLIFNDKIIITHYGYFKKFQIEIFIDKIEEISVTQNIFSRVLGYGKLSIKNISGSHNSIFGIKAPANVKNQIQKCVSIEKYKCS